MDPKLLFRIGGDASEWRKAVGTVTDDANRLTSLVSKIGAASLAGIGLAAIPAFINQTARGIDALNDLSDVTGSTVEKLSALEDAALRTGNSFESVQTTLVKFNNVLKEADGKNGPSQALKAIGLDAAELRKLDPADAIVKVAQALSTFRDNGDKARLVQELFGKSIAEVGPLLKDLADKSLGVATVTTEQARQAERYNRELAQLSKNSLDLARSLTSSLIPALSDTIKGFREGGVRGAFDAIGEAIGLGREYYANRELKILKDDLDGLRAALATAAPGSGDSKAIQKAIDDKTAELRSAQKALVTIQSAGQPGRRPLNEGGGGYKAPAVKFSGVKPVKNAPIKDPIEEAERRSTEALEKYIERDIELEEKRTQQAREQLVQRLLNAGDFGLQLQAQTEELSVGLIVDERQRGEALLQIDRDRMSDQIEALEITNEARLRLYDLLNQNIVARQAALNEQLKPEWQRLLDGWRDTTQQMKQFSDDFMTSFIRNGEQAFTEFVSTGKLNVRSLTNFITQEFARLAYQKYLAQSVSNVGSSLLQGLTTIVSALGSGGGAGNGNAGQNYDGQVVNNPSGYTAPPLATGTNYVPYDGFLATLHKGEAVVPAAYNPSAGGGSDRPIMITDNRTIQVGQLVSPNELSQALRVSNSELVERLRQSRTRDGAFA